MTPAHLHRAFMLSLLSSPALGFAGGRQNQNVMRKPPAAAEPAPNTAEATRAEFISGAVLGAAALLAPAVAHAFDGGVGGLGKTRPETGVVFRDPEAAAMIAQSSAGDVGYELVSPDGAPVLLSFSAPWPLSKSAAGIEARDTSERFESTYVQVVELPRGITSVDDVRPGLMSDAIFGPAGKFGMYGVPTDIKIKKTPLRDGAAAVYLASFTALTPAMRESDRKAYISASVVGNGLFLLVTTTTAARFGKLEGTLRAVADSFAAVAAPKSSLNPRNSP